MLCIIYVHFLMPRLQRILIRCVLTYQYIYVTDITYNYALFMLKPVNVPAINALYLCHTSQGNISNGVHALCMFVMHQSN